MDIKQSGVAKPNDRKNYGVYVFRDVKPGEVITEYTGKTTVMTNKQVEALPEERGNYLITLDNYGQDTRTHLARLDGDWRLGYQTSYGPFINDCRKINEQQGKCKVNAYFSEDNVDLTYYKRRGKRYVRVNQPLEIVATREIKGSMKHPKEVFASYGEAFW